MVNEALSNRKLAEINDEKVMCSEPRDISVECVDDDSRACGDELLAEGHELLLCGLCKLQQDLGN